MDPATSTQLVGRNSLDAVQDASTTAPVMLTSKGRLIMTMFLVIQQVGLVVKYLLPDDGDGCSVYKLTFDKCEQLLLFGLAQALIYCSLFMLFVCSVGQDAMRRAFRDKSRLLFLCFALLCVDITYAVVTNEGYFTQAFVNVFEYLLFACAAIFEVQFASAIICGGRDASDNDSTRCLWQTALVVSYYFVLVENFMALTIIDDSIEQAATNHVGALIQVALEIAVIVECFLLPLFAESEHTGHANQSRTDVTDESLILTPWDRFRCRMCLSAFIVIQFVAMWIKYLIPSRTGDYDCSVYRFTRQDTCREQFICALVQSITYPVLFFVLVWNIRPRNMRSFAALNKRLLFLCVLLTLVNLMYLVIVQLPGKHGAYALQVVNDPLAAVIEGLAAVLEVQHWGEREPHTRGFVWRLLITISYIVLLVSYIVITIRLDSALDAAASGLGDDARRIAFAHVLVETATVIECLLLALFDSHRIVRDPHDAPDPSWSGGAAPDGAAAEPAP